MTLLSVGVRVGGDEVVEDDQEEEGDAEHVGEHGELRVGDHFDFDLAPAAKGKLLVYVAQKNNRQTSIVEVH